MGKMRKFKAEGIKKTRYSPNNFDSDYFSKYSNESAYWAGFLAADAYITNKVIVFSLSSKDVCVLEAFKIAIGFNGPINTRETKYIRKDGTKAYTSTISIRNCPHIVKSLVKNYGIPLKNKSLGLLPPNLPQKYILPYIIGFIDGDGWISGGEKRPFSNIKELNVGVCGTIEMLKWIRREFSVIEKSYYKIIKIQQPNQDKTKNHFALRYKGYRAYKLIKKLNEVKLDFKLPRKWNKINIIDDIFSEINVNGQLGLHKKDKIDNYLIKNNKGYRYKTSIG